VDVVLCVVVVLVAVVNWVVMSVVVALGKLYMLKTVPPPLDVCVVAPLSQMGRSVGVPLLLKVGMSATIWKL
jgi:hypothetical protein